MASPASGGTTTTSSGSYLIQSSELMDDQLKKRKLRMTSNRESARRSRMRKQKHLDDLTTQLSQLRKQNNEIMSSVSITTQHCMSVEAENYVLRVQLAELTHHLHSLIMCQPAVDNGCGFVDDFITTHTLM